MNYRLLNEVLIEWNESPEDDSNNVFLKSEDIKESLDRCFVYRLDKKDQIKIFDIDWSKRKKYRNKVQINGKHVELDREGFTVNEFEPGEYRVYIEDIDNVGADRVDMTYMFYGCEQLISAFIPNSVTSTGDKTFCDCHSLTSVTIPNSIVEIGYYTFAFCTDLTSITIPNSVTSIGYWAFYGCDSLTSITIPNSVTEIGTSAFYSCDNLKKVYIEDINKFNRIKFENAWSDPRYYGAKLVELKK